MYNVYLQATRNILEQNKRVENPHPIASSRKQQLAYPSSKPFICLMMVCINIVGIRGKKL
jgi:hypothetical protein